MPLRVTGLAEAFAAAAALVKAAEAEATATTEELDAPEREALKRAFGEGSTGKGVATAVRRAAGALKELDERQKSRATRIKRDALDLALLDLAAFLAESSDPGMTVRRIEAIMRCRERLAASVAPLLAVEELTLALAERPPAVV